MLQNILEITFSAFSFLPVLSKAVAMMNSRMQLKTKSMQRSIQMSR